MATAAVSKCSFTVFLMFLVLNCFQNTKVSAEEFTGSVVSDMEVNIPAEKVWEVYGRQTFNSLMLQLLPGYLKQVEFISGNGKLGSVSNITLQPAFGSTNWVEKLIVFDNKTMTRVVRQLKGGNLDLGFTLYDSGFRIMKKSKNTCVIRVFTPFKIKREALANATALNPTWDVTVAIVNYIKSMKD